MNWDMANQIGYKPITTFWQDFTIAEVFGEKAIEDTFNRAFNEWKTNYKYLTELVLVLNHKIWKFYKTNNDMAKLYDKLWHKADLYATSELKGEGLDYFYRVTD